LKNIAAVGVTQNSMNQDYARAFRVIRAAFGLKQSELAERMPVTSSQLSLIEAGKRQPSLRVLNALAQAVGVPVALIALLASDPREIDSKPNEDISDLARALLRLLVSAGEDPQRSLALGGGDA
jgi:transcriptional regulator with XRE-family HTH domain